MTDLPSLLLSLNEGEFARLLARLGVSSDILPGPAAPLAVRQAALLEWCRGKPEAERLAQLLTPTGARAMPPSPTIGILTALPKELAAVRVMLEGAERWTADGQGGGREYWIGRIPSAQGGQHVVAVALLPDMGNNSAAMSATNLLHHFPTVEHIFLCGIAGGVPRPGEPEHDVRLGDIVVSNRNGVIQYDLVKEKPDGSQEHRHPPRPPSATLLAAVRHLEAEDLLNRQPWQQFLPRGAGIKRAARPADNVDARGEPITYPPDPDRTPGLPRVFAAPVAAANNLLKNPTHRDYLAREFGVKAIEMEGSGVADAAWLSERAGYLVVRGICDYCDERKGDVWQGYAAVAAAAYVRALLSEMAPANPR